MYHKARLVCDPESPYTCDNFAGECEEKCRCCVPFDTAERSERCCALSRISADRYDYLDCGYTNEEEDMPEKEYKVHRVKRYARWGSRIDSIVWLIIGLLALISPARIMFTVVIDEEYRHQYDIDTHSQLRLEEEYVKEKQKFDAINPSVGSLFANIFSKFYSSAEVTPEDKQGLTRQLGMLSTELAKNAQKVAMTGPTQIYGAVALYFACMSFNTHWYRLSSDYFDESITTHSIFWYAFNIIGFAAASTGRGEGIGSSTFLIVMLVSCFVGFIFWFFMRDKIIFLHHKKRRGPLSDNVGADVGSPPPVYAPVLTPPPRSAPAP